VLDARDREGLAGPKRRADDGHGARSSVARICAQEGVRCALFTSAFGPGLAAEALALGGVLVARTGPVFVPWERGSAPVRWLDALDSGGTVDIDRDEPWHSTYGPELLDGVLDLLLDGVEGGVNFVPRQGGTHASVARAVAHVAERDAANVTCAAECDPATHGSGLDVRPTYLPILDTTLERFVRECRLARAEGEFAVGRKDDEVRMEDAG
jgi:dTDP-4-dehydrorhamnose reductase